MAKVDSQDWRDRYDEMSKRYAQLYNKRMPIMEDYENSINNTLDTLVGETVPGIRDLMRTSRGMTQLANEEYLPAAREYMQQARGYDTTERRMAASQAAMTDVMGAGEASRQSAIARLESYGIDPSMTRGAALDQNERVQSALEAVRQGRQAASEIEEKGRAFQRDALSVGAGIQQGALGTASTASGLGTAAIGAGNATAANMGNIFGTPMDNLQRRKELIDASWNAKATETQLKLANKAGKGSAIGGIASALGTAAGLAGGAYLGSMYGDPVGGAALGAQVGGGMANQQLPALY